MRQARQNSLWQAFAAAFVCLVLFLTLRPGSLAIESWIHGCLLCGPYGLADALRNLALFIPLGFLLPRALGSWKIALIAAVLLTASVEVAQLVIPGRDGSPVDVFFNTLGGSVGIGLFATLNRWLPPGPKPGARRVALYVGALLAVVFAGGLASTPDFPEGAVIGQWAPIRDGFTPFTGLVHSVDIEDSPVPAWAVPNGRDVFQRFLDGDPLALRFTRGTYSEDPQLLVRIVMPAQRELLQIAVQGDGVLVRPRTAFTKLRLFEPATLVPNVLNGVPTGDPIRLSLFRSDDNYCAQTSRLDEPVCEPAMTAARLWMMGVNAHGWTRLALAALTVIGVVAVAIPIGWWGGWSLGFLGAAVVAIGCWAVTDATALGLAAWEITPLMAGALLGAGFQHRLRARYEPEQGGTDLESAAAMTPAETR